MEITLWFIFLVVCIIAEAMTFMSLVAIWFIPGTIAAIVLAALKVPFIIQMLVFAVVSLISLFIIKNIIQAKQKNAAKTNSDSLIGKVAKLQSDHTRFQNATVKFGDIVWNVKTIDNTEFKKDTVVEVVGIEGNTLIVQKGE